MENDGTVLYRDLLKTKEEKETKVKEWFSEASEPEIKDFLSDFSVYQLRYLLEIIDENKYLKLRTVLGLDNKK